MQCYVGRGLMERKVLIWVERMRVVAEGLYIVAGRLRLAGTGVRRQGS